MRDAQSALCSGCVACGSTTPRRRSTKHSPWPSRMGSSTSSALSASCCATSRGTSFDCPSSTTRSQMTMNDDIEQLLTQLRLKPLREIVERELARAQKTKPSYAEFYARILREHYAVMQARSRSEERRVG